MATLAEIDAEIAKRQSGPSIADIEAEIARRQPEGQSIGQIATGAADILGLAGTTIAKEGIKGLSTAGGLIAPLLSGDPEDFGGPQQVVSNAKALEAILPNFQLGEEGERLASTLIEKFKDSPQIIQELFTALSTLGPTTGESTFQALKDTPLAPAAPALAALVGAVPGALEAATALKVPRAVAGAVGRAGEAVVPTAETVQDIFTKQSPAKQRIASLIKSGSTDVDTAKFKLSAKVDSQGRPRVEKDPLGSEAIKQGFDEGVVAAVKGSNAADKKKLRQMVNIMERGKKNARFAATNRPSDVLGDSVMTRLRIVQKANRAAGQDLDRVAKSLKGKAVDFSPAVTGFIDDLSDMGITLKDDLSLDFRGSDIEGLSGPEKAMSRIVKRMTSKATPDAFDVHRLKRFIDEQVTFGKNAEGLAGKAESVLKTLRRNLDQTLDNNFPEYDRINSAYSETIGALDAFQDVAGKKMDLTGPNADKATGTLMRRVLSNAQSRVTLLDSVEEIERVAKKFENFKGGKLDPRLIEGPKEKTVIDDDLLSQVLFADELDSVFGPVARTSLQGQIRQGVSDIGGLAAEAKVSPVTAAVKGAASIADKTRGINQESQFKAIKKLLSGG